MTEIKDFLFRDTSPEYSGGCVTDFRFRDLPAVAVARQFRDLLNKITAVECDADSAGPWIDPDGEPWLDPDGEEWEAPPD